MNLPNKSTIGGMEVFHKGNHNESGNPHPQYVLDKIYVIPSDDSSNIKWAKILETYVTNNTTTNFIYLVQSGGNSNANKLNALVYIDFNVLQNGSVNVKISVDDEEIFPITNLGYKIENGKIKLYMKSNYEGNSLILRLVSKKIESGTIYIDNIVYESLSDVLTVKSRKIGLTADRPTGVTIGYQYYDKNLGRPIWWNGSVWTNATGSQV